MKKLLQISLSIFFTLTCLTSFAAAELRPIFIEWSYSGTAKQFILYDGANNEVCKSPEYPAAYEMECDIFLDGSGMPLYFTMTAIDNNGIETPPTNLFEFIPPQKDAYGNYLPQVDLQVSTTSGEAPLTVNFDASNSSDLDGTISSYDWTFGDGSSASGSSTSHIFDTPGTYTTTLTATDNSNGESEVNAIITVTGDSPPPSQNSLPIAAFTAIVLVPGTSQVGFDASSSYDTDGTITNYEWSLGDGTEMPDNQNVEYTFGASGDYNVSLVVIDDEGGRSATEQMVITIQDSLNILPEAVISASVSKKIAQLEWDYPSNISGLAGFRFYQNGNLVCETADPNARSMDCAFFIESGTTTLSLRSYFDNGDESSDSEIFTFDSTGLADRSLEGFTPLTVYFNGNNSNDSDGTIGSYSWDFGDGDTATGASIQHIYATPGQYTVTLTVTDDSGDTHHVSEIITVMSTNNPPSANGKAITTAENTDTSGTLSASDQDGDSLTYSIVSNASSGTANITNSTTGAFTYTPNLDANGSDFFTFKVNDGEADSNIATVNIAISPVNDEPVATNSNLTINEDELYSGTLSASDPDGDSLTYSIVSNASSGTANITNSTTGAFTYTPNLNANGSDSFTFKVNEGEADSNIATVNITISPVNDEPVAQADSAQTNEDNAVMIAVLDNDTDPENDSLTASLTSQATNGIVTIVNNQAQYTPGPNFHGSDAFMYRITDSKGLSDSATVNITVNSVNDLPVATIAATASSEQVEKNIHFTWDYSNSGESPQISLQTIEWTDVVGVSTSGNTITKTANEGWGNAGATSTIIISGDGGVNFLAAENNSFRMCGLSPSSPDSSWNTIGYAIYLQENAKFSVYENGKFKGDFGNYKANDRFVIERNGSTITYQKNGTVFHTSETASTDGLLVDVAIYSSGGTITDANIFTTLQQISLQTIEWADVLGVSTSGNTITKTVNEGWGNAGATSTKIISGDGGVNFLAAENNSFRMCGLSSSNPDSNWNTIGYAIYLQDNAKFSVYENGKFKGNFGNYKANDRFVIERNGSTITYQKNGTVFHTSETASTDGLLVDVAIYSSGGTITDANIFTTLPIDEAPLSGFNFYYNDTLACQTKDPTAREMDCLVTLSQGEARFWLTAFKADGTETNVSEVFITKNQTSPTSNVLIGTAPLTVNLDGSASNDPDGRITSYLWDFGDGNSASGATVQHIYNAASEHTIKLTVTDNQGGVATSQVIATTKEAQNPTNENQAPTAIDLDMTINMDSQYSGTLVAIDPENDNITFSIALNNTNGAVILNDPATGSFTYTPNQGVTGADSFTYLANDGNSDSNNATVSINITAPEPPAIIFEAGEITIDHNWKTVSLAKSYRKPVIIAKPASYNDSAPGIIRIRNATADSFEVRFQEWDYLDGLHPPETASYIVMEEGIYELNDGTRISAGTFNTNSTVSFSSISFNQTFQTVPVVVASIITDNEADSVTNQIKSISTNGFSLKLREQEGNAMSHATEDIAYIAWEPSSGIINGRKFEVSRTPDFVNHNWASVPFLNEFTSSPLLIADLQTTDGGDTSSLRYQFLTASQVQIKVEEEQSSNEEVQHTSEVAGYILLSR